MLVFTSYNMTYYVISYVYVYITRYFSVNYTWFEFCFTHSVCSLVLGKSEIPK